MVCREVEGALGVIKRDGSLTAINSGPLQCFKHSLFQKRIQTRKEFGRAESGVKEVLLVHTCSFQQAIHMVSEFGME
jgi:hypothetical protein